MSKLPLSSMCNRSTPSLAVLLVIVGCLSPRAGIDSSTDVELTGETGSSGLSEPIDSTDGGIMTTTEDPDDETSSGETAEPTTADATTTTGEGTTTTGDVPGSCGNGVVEAPEECDAGMNNADDGACTTACKNAICGDGHVQTGVEVCDDMVNDGSYDGCAASCKALGPYCGDSEIQPGFGETCDDPSGPTSGCLMGQCKQAHSCLEIKESWGDAAGNGMYTIFPKDALEVYCDMEADDGGYTFVKINHTQIVSASMAESVCEQLGLRLLVPRSALHLTAMASVADNNTIQAIGGGPVPNSPLKYLSIFGIYPKTVGTSCTGQPLKSTTCPEWTAGNDESYFVSDTALDANQPSTDQCLDCSMSYTWTLDPVPTLTKYSAFSNNDQGATSQHFLCDVGDKRPPVI